MTNCTSAGDNSGANLTEAYDEGVEINHPIPLAFLLVTLHYNYHGFKLYSKYKHCLTPTHILEINTMFDRAGAAAMTMIIHLAVLLPEDSWAGWSKGF